MGPNFKEKIRKSTGMEKAQDDVQSQNKELKKLMDSHIAVLTHKLGRAPTPEEVMKAMVEEPQEQQEVKQQEDASLEDEAPGVLNYRIFFGMKEKEGKDGSKSKEPDPSNVLFYHDPKKNRWYDVEARSWNESQPPMTAHLPDRVMEDDGQGSDIRDAIIHGVMEDDDFQKLCDVPGMVDDRLKKLFSLMKTITTGSEQLQAMGKSEDMEDAPDVQPESQLEDQTDQPVSEFGGENLVDSFLDTAGVRHGDESFENVEALETEDLPQQIAEVARGSGVEKRIRKWIRDELEIMKQDILEEVWAMINHSVEQEIGSTEEVVGHPTEFADDESEAIVDDLDDEDGGPEEMPVEQPVVEATVQPVEKSSKRGRPKKK